MDDAASDDVLLLRRVVDVFPLPTVVTDRRLRALHANQRWIALAGHDDGRWRDLGWWSVLAPGARSVERIALRQCVETGSRYRADWILDHVNPPRRLRATGQSAMPAAVSPEVGTADGEGEVISGLAVIVTIVDVTDLHDGSERPTAEAPSDVFQQFDLLTEAANRLLAPATAAAFAVEMLRRNFDGLSDSERHDILAVLGRSTRGFCDELQALLDDGRDPGLRGRSERW